jgi:hypothetical protein
MLIVRMTAVLSGALVGLGIGGLQSGWSVSWAVTVRRRVAGSTP